MGVIKRLKEYLDYKGIANYRAEQECGLSNGLIKNALKAGSSIGSDKLENILNAYSDLSAEWLMRGEGSMIKNDSKAVELENLISMASSNHERREQAYEILIGMFDTMQKTYEFFRSQS